MDTFWSKESEITQICDKLTSQDNPPRERQEIVDMLVQLTKCIKASRLGGEKLPYDMIVVAIRPLAANAFDWVIRGVALRTLRYLTIEGQAIKVLHQRRLHLFIIRSLEREHKLAWERMQALNLVRQMMRVNAELISRCILKSITALAGSKTDPLRAACLETLRELSITCTRAVSETGGIKTIVNAILDPLMKDHAESLTMSLAYLMNNPAKRCFLRPSLDVVALLSPLTDTGSVGLEDQPKKWEASRRAVVTLMKTWAGFISIASDTHGLRALVQMLVQPVSARLRVAILQTFLEVLINVTPTRTSSMSYQKGALFRAMEESIHEVPDKDEPTPLVSRMPTFRRRQSDQLEDVDMNTYWGVGPGSTGSVDISSTGLQGNRVMSLAASTHSLLDNFMSMVLLALVSCGILEALAQLSINAPDKELARMAMHLLSYIMQNISRYLPENLYRPLLSFPTLLEKAVKASEPQTKSARTETQRGVAVVRLLARTVGLGYDNAYATYLSRSACDNGITLASELALAASGERVRLENNGIFPRSGVLMLQTGIPGHSGGGGGTSTSVFEEGSTSSLLSPTIMGNHKTKRNIWQGIRSLGKGSSTDASGLVAARDGALNASGSLFGMRSNSRGSMKRSNRHGAIGANPGRLQRISSRLDLTMTPQPSPAVKSITQGDLEWARTARAIPHDANRGHRHLIGQLVVTDLAHTRVGEFFRLLNHTKVLAGKDFTKWDWAMIDEVLSGPCQNHELLVEALKTKFIKRVAGFFRITTIGEYMALSWTPDNIYYTNVATNLIRTLLDAPEGVSFLKTDRRGKIAVQLVAALDLELSPFGDDVARSAFGLEGYVPQLAGFSATRPEHLRTQSSTSTPGQSRGYGDSAAYPNEGEADYVPNALYEGVETGRIFTRGHCVNTMVREFFVLAGVYTSHATGIAILRDLGFFDVLTRLSRRPDKDYLTRLLVTHLDYTASQECREWLQLTLLNNRISFRLRVFSIGILRGLLRTSHTQAIHVSRWVLELLFFLLKFGGAVAGSALSVLIEAAHYPAYLDVMLSLGLTPLLRVLDLPAAQPLLIKYLGSAAGLEMLRANRWVDNLVDAWFTGGNLQYVFTVEAKIAAELTKDIPAIPPLPPAARSDLPAAGRPVRPSLVQRAPTAVRVSPYAPVPIPVRAHEAGASENAETGFESTDILSLFRLPWRVELWAVTAGGEQARVALDTYVDCETLRPESPLGSLPGGAGGIRVTATPQPRQQATDLGADEEPVWHVPEDCTLYACLCVGAQPVDPQGQLRPRPSGAGGFVVPTRAEAAGDLSEQRAHSRDRTGSSPVAEGPMARAVGGRRRPMSGLRYSLGRSGTHRPNPSVAEAEELSRLWASKDSVLPLEDPLWTQVAPEHRFEGAQAAEAHRRAEEGGDLVDAAEEDTVVVSGKPLAFEICPQADCNASFLLERRSAVPGQEPKGSELSVSAGGLAGQGNQHNIINPLFAKAAAAGNPKRFAGPLSGTSVDSDSGLSPAARGERMSEAAPSQTVVLKSISFALELVPHRAATPSIPTHVYGELARSDRGVEMLSKLGHVQQFVDQACEPGIRVINRRAALWAIGHIGCSSKGLHLLLHHRTKVLEQLSALALGDPCLSIRGTALYCLGMLSRTPLGRARLEKLGWECLASSGSPFASLVVVPRTPSNFFKLSQPSTPVTVWNSLGHRVEGEFLAMKTRKQRNPESSPNSEVDEKLRETVRSAISDLCNGIAQKEAHGKLKDIRTKHPGIFRDLSLMLDAHEMLARYSYKPSLRQFTMDLFNRRIDFSNPQVWGELDGLAMR